MCIRMGHRQGSRFQKDFLVSTKACTYKESEVGKGGYERQGRGERGRRERGRERERKLEDREREREK